MGYMGIKRRRFERRFQKYKLVLRQNAPKKSKSRIKVLFTKQGAPCVLYVIPIYPTLWKKIFLLLFSSMYCMTPTRYDLRAWGRLIKTIFKNFPDIDTHFGTNLHYIPVVISKSALPIVQYI
jgi:hypothetical protein